MVESVAFVDNGCSGEGEGEERGERRKVRKGVTDNSKISGLKRCKEGVAIHCFYLRGTDEGGRFGREGEEAVWHLESGCVLGTHTDTGGGAGRVLSRLRNCQCTGGTEPHVT